MTVFDMSEDFGFMRPTHSHRLQVDDYSTALQI